MNTRITAEVADGIYASTTIPRRLRRWGHRRTRITGQLVFDLLIWGAGLGMTFAGLWFVGIPVMVITGLAMTSHYRSR